MAARTGSPVRAMRIVLLQGCTRTLSGIGREVVKRGGARVDGPSPPGSRRLASPLCTASKIGRRQLIPQPREMREALKRTRARHEATGWKREGALRAGAVEPSTGPPPSPVSAGPAAADCEEPTSTTSKARWP